MITRILLLAIGILCSAFFGRAAGAEPLVAGSSPTEAKPSELPTHLQWTRDNPDKRPPPEVRRAVRAEDKAWLMREYHGQPKRGTRIAIAWLLAYVGDDEVFRLFSEALTLGPGSKTPDKGNLGVCFELLFGMGVMAQTNELAFQFLTQAIDHEWWKRERTWREKGETPSGNGFLAGASVWALGLTARSEAGVILDRIRTEGWNNLSSKDPRERYDVAANAYEAKRYLEISRKMGGQAFRDGLFGAEFKRYSLEWRKSEEGLKWLEWACPKDGWPWIWKDLDAHHKFLESRFD